MTSLLTSKNKISIFSQVEAVKTLLSLGADPFDGASASLYNSNPACPYWLALDIKLKVENFGSVKWQHDDAVLACNLCNKQFTLFNRRHHCRFCGDIVCGSCSNVKIHGLRSCKTCSEAKKNGRDQGGKEDGGEEGIAHHEREEDACDQQSDWKSWVKITQKSPKPAK